MMKQRLKQKQLVIGSWLSMPSTAIAETLCLLDIDFLVIDLEHSCLSMRECEELIRTIDLAGKSPLVRLSSADPVQAKRVLDAGAHGIIVPMVKSAQEAKLMVEATYFPPRGSRGVGLGRAQKYGMEFKSYFSHRCQELIVIAQIEHIDAVENFRDILSVDGIDGFMIGPYDLSASMGIPGEFDRPEFKEVLNEIDSMSKSMGLIAGIHIVEPNPIDLVDKVNHGYKFIAYGVDFKLIQQSMSLGLSALSRENKK